MIEKRIKYKRQLIEITLECPSNKYKYRIKYFPASLCESGCAWKMIQCPESFITLDAAIKDARARVDLEIGKEKWVFPEKDVFKDYKEESY